MPNEKGLIPFFLQSLSSELLYIRKEKESDRIFFLIFWSIDVVLISMITRHPSDILPHHRQISTYRMWSMVDCRGREEN